MFVSEGEVRVREVGGRREVVRKVMELPEASILCFGRGIFATIAASCSGITAGALNRIRLHVAK